VNFAAEMLSPGTKTEGAPSLFPLRKSSPIYVGKLLDIAQGWLTFRILRQHFMMRRESIGKNFIYQKLKQQKRGRIAETLKSIIAVFTPVDPSLEYNPLWNHKAMCAFPSATRERD
jgi:glutamate dehydrogenase (NADP+)